MNRLTQTITLLVLLIASTASAQRAVILELPNGQYVGLVYLANGETVIVPTVQVIKLPTDVPDPDPPPNTSGPVTSVVFRIAAKMNAAQAEALIDVRDWVDLQDSKEFHHYVFAPNAEDPDGSVNQPVKQLHDKMPAGAFYPYGFITRRSGDKDVILWQGEIKDAPSHIERMQQMSSKQSSPMVPYTERRGNR